MSNTAHAKQVCKPKKLPFVIMCILSAIVAVLNVLLCVLVPKYYTTINSFLYKGPDADEVAAYRQASADMTQKVESEGVVMLENKNQTLPLASGSKINLFGYGSRDTVYGGSGSGSGDSSNSFLFVVVFVMAGRQNKRQLLICARTSSRKSMPEPSGRSRSQQTTSGISSWMAARASFSVQAVFTG